MFNIRTIFLGLLSFYGTAVYAEPPVNGSMDCKVVDQIVIAAVDGKSKRYPGVTNKFEIGDPLLFEYQTTLGDLFLGLYDEKRTSTVINTLIDPSNAVVTFSSKSGVGLKDSRDFGSITEERIVIRSLLDMLVLHRYYKGDWSGLYVRDVPSKHATQQIAVLDCRGKDDNVTGVIKELHKTYPVSE